MCRHKNLEDGCDGRLAEKTAGNCNRNQFSQESTAIVVPVFKTLHLQTTALGSSLAPRYNKCGVGRDRRDGVRWLTMIAAELVTYLATAGVGTSNVTLFANWMPPTPPGARVS